MTTQYYIDDYVSWVPRLTLLDLWTNWTCELFLKQNSFICRRLSVNTLRSIDIVTCSKIIRKGWFGFLFYFLIFICLAASVPSCDAQDLYRIMRDLLLLCMRSLVVARGIRSAQASVVAVRHSRSIDCRVLVPRPGIEPTSPALQGRVLIPEPPGKSLLLLLNAEGWVRGWVRRLTLPELN